MKLLIKIVVFLFITLIISYFVPIKTSQQTTIKASFIDVANEVNTGDKWKNWYAPIKYAHATSPSSYKLREDYKNHKIYLQTIDNYYEINKYSPAWIELRIGKNIKTTQTIHFTFDKDGYVTINEIQSTSLLNYLLKLVKPDVKHLSIVKSLKPFMETPSLYYGFDIKKTTVPDTAFITSTAVVSKRDRFIMLKNTYPILRQFAIKNKVRVVGYPYLNYSSVNADSIKITTMLVINKALTLYDEGKINLFAMPKNGRMLVAHYHGEYGKSSEVYTALDRYASDNNYTRVYVPFERYLGNVPTSNQSIVDMDVFYPVY